MILHHPDCPARFRGKARRAAGAGCPCKGRNAVHEIAQDNPSGAGQIWPVGALLVDHDATASLTPRASPRAKSGSVRAVQYHVIML